MEATIDQAIALNAGLIRSIVEGRLATGVAVHFGQDAIDKAAHTILQLSTARRAAIATHDELASVKTMMGLSALSFGDVGPKPAPPRGEEGTSLRAVA
ncbi:hypothetical protein ACNI3Q_00465 [Sphingomonas sp. FW199]|uniref:hypothetical protein n=1 Tax=Sphingomonas sp. FW199 TaxID=3400217 RepID=UPI003CEB1AD0